MAAGTVKEKTAGAKKEPVEIKCSACGTQFRLWIPADVLPEWEKGSNFSCIKCGRKYFIRKDKNRFSLTAVKEEPVERPVEAPRVEPLKPSAPRPQATRPEPVVNIPEPPVSHGDEPRASGAYDTVLLVDDERLAREMVDNTLKDTGIRLLKAKNAAEAIRILRKESVGLIVTDMYLKNPEDPESQMDGEELLKKVADAGADIPAIITTGKDIIDDLVLDPKWFDLHVKGFIQKGNPFWIEELKGKIKEVLSKD